MKGKRERKRKRTERGQIHERKIGRWNKTRVNKSREGRKREEQGWT